MRCGSNTNRNILPTSTIIGGVPCGRRLSAEAGGPVRSCKRGPGARRKVENVKDAFLVKRR